LIFSELAALSAMSRKDVWTISTSEDESDKVTRSKYAPVVEPCRKKSRKEEGKTPPGFNKRFPGGGFAARMKAAEKRWELLKIEKSEGRNTASHQKGKKVAKKKMCALKGDLKVKKEKTDGAVRVETNLVGSSLRDHKDVEEDIIEDFDSQELLENGIEGETKSEVETAKKGVVQEAVPRLNFTVEGLSTVDVIEEEEGDAIADLFSDFEASIGQESQD